MYLICKNIRNFFWYLLSSVFIIFEDVPDSLISLLDEEKIIKDNDGKKVSDDANIGGYRKIVFGAVLVCWAGFLFGLTYSYNYFSNKSTVFIVTANVEQLVVSPYGNLKYPSFRLNDATLFKDCSENKMTVSGVIYPDSTSYIEFLRIQKKDLMINFDNEIKDSSGIFVPESGDDIILGDCASVRVRINENDSYVFPINGGIMLGGDIKHGADMVPILYSGEINIIDKTYLTDIYYTVGPFKLEMGDVFSIDGAVLNSSGFVHVSDDKGIKVTFSSKGSKGYIKKYQTNNIELENGFLTKIYNDQSLIALWFLVLFFFALCKAIIRICLSKIEDIRSALVQTKSDASV